MQLVKMNGLIFLSASPNVNFIERFTLLKYTF